MRFVYAAPMIASVPAVTSDLRRINCRVLLAYCVGLDHVSRTGSDNGTCGLGRMKYLLIWRSRADKRHRHIGGLRYVRHMERVVNQVIPRSLFLSFASVEDESHNSGNNNHTCRYTASNDCVTNPFCNQTL